MANRINWWSSHFVYDQIWSCLIFLSLTGANSLRQRLAHGHKAEGALLTLQSLWGEWLVYLWLIWCTKREADEWAKREREALARLNWLHFGQNPVFNLFFFHVCGFSVRPGRVQARRAFAKWLRLDRSRHWSGFVWFFRHFITRALQAWPVELRSMAKPLPMMAW